VSEKEFFIFLGNQLKDRLRFHFDKDKGDILDLVIQYETLINEKWVAVVRYDCAHGFFHRDLLHPNGGKNGAYPPNKTEFNSLLFGLKTA
jgi:hypothetical protein